MSPCSFCSKQSLLNFWNGSSGHTLLASQKRGVGAQLRLSHAKGRLQVLGLQAAAPGRLLSAAPQGITQVAVCTRHKENRAWPASGGNLQWGKWRLSSQNL
jgi:hypothetical protein